MKYAFLTIDVEEWYDLEYLRKYHLESTDVEVVPELFGFLDLLDRLNVKATFFVLASTLEKNIEVIQEIADRGHAIGCHGLDHELLYKKEDRTFYEEIKKAKLLIEQNVNCEVKGYRASCFSMEKSKLEMVMKAGYSYDSSKISFAQHSLYRDLDIDKFEKADDLVYRYNDFFEYEIPTIQLGKFRVPISGGGYMRLLPFWLIKYLIKKYCRFHNNFLIYIHPFELTNMALPFDKVASIKNRFRAAVGRKNNLIKLRKTLLFLKNLGAEFRTLEYDRKCKLES